MDWTTLRRSQALSVPERLSVDLERLVLERRLKPGDRLPPERELGELLGVSRTSIREALHELESRGFVDRKPGRGTVVVSASHRGGEAGAAISSLLELDAPSSVALNRMMEVRAMIEPPIAALATKRVTDRDLAQLRALVEDMETEEDLARYAELDRAFHQAISQYTHNPLLAQLTEIISEQLAPARRSPMRSKERRDISSADHRRIYNAIAARDPEKAEAEARAHVDRILVQAIRAQNRAQGTAADGTSEDRGPA